MPLERTTIVPDDPIAAKAIYDEQVAHEKRTIMVIIGNTQTVEDAIAVADGLAHLVNPGGFNRWVLWAKDHDIVEDTLALIIAESKDRRSNKDFNEFKCFCISPVSRQVDGIILKNGNLGALRLRHAFIKTEKLDVSQ